MRSTNIFTRAIEPNAHSISLYKDNIERSLNDDQTSFELLGKTLEEYQQERSSNESRENQIKFDIVHFIHSLYYVDIEETLSYCFDEELQENGQVVCVISDFITRNIFSKLSDYVKQFGKTCPDESYAEKIMDIAEKRGWKVDHYMREHSVDFTEVFDEKSSEGNLLLEFLTQTKDFRARTDTKKVEEILQVILDISTEKDGKRLGNKVDDLLFIYQ
jgi:hypothetical protein